MKNVIKKVLLFCLTFVLLLSPTILLTACGGPGDNPGEESGGGSKPKVETPSAVSKNDDFKELYDIAKGVIESFNVNYSNTKSNAVNAINYSTLTSKLTSKINEDKTKLDVTENAGDSIRAVFEQTLLTVLACGDVLTNNYGYTTLFGANATIGDPNDEYNEHIFYSITKVEAKHSATYSLYVYTDYTDERYVNYATLNLTISDDNSFNFDYIFFDNDKTSVQFAYGDSSSHFIYINTSSNYGSAITYNGISAYESQDNKYVDVCKQIVLDSLDVDAIKASTKSIKDKHCETIQYDEFNTAVQYYIDNLLTTRNTVIGSIFTIQNGCLVGLYAGEDFDQRVLTIPNSVTSISLNTLNIPACVYTIIIPDSVAELKIRYSDESEPYVDKYRSLTLQDTNDYLRVNYETGKCNLFEAYDRTTNSWHGVDIAVSENSSVIKEIQGNRYIKIENEWYLYSIDNPEPFNNIQPDWHIDYNEFKIQTSNFWDNPDDYVKPAGSQHQTQVEIMDTYYPTLLPCIRRFYQQNPLSFAHFNNVTIDVDITQDTDHELDFIQLNTIANFEYINNLTLNITYGNQSHPQFTLSDGNIIEIGKLVVNQNKGAFNIRLYNEYINGKYYGRAMIHDMEFSEGIESIFVICQTDTDVINVPISVNSTLEGICDLAQMYALNDLTINYNYAKVCTTQMAEGKSLTITTKLNRYYNPFLLGEQPYGGWQQTIIGDLYENLTHFENIKIEMQSPIWYANFENIEIIKENELYKYTLECNSDVTEISLYEFTDWTKLLDANNTPTNETKRIVVTKNNNTVLDFDIDFDNITPENLMLSLDEGHNIFTLTAINDFGEIRYTIDIYRKSLHRLIFHKNCDDDDISDKMSDGYEEDARDFWITMPYSDYDKNTRFAYQIAGYYTDAECTTKLTDEYADIILNSAGKDDCPTEIHFSSLPHSIHVYAKWAKRNYYISYETAMYGSYSFCYQFNSVTIPANSPTTFDIESNFDLVADVTPTEYANCYRFLGWSTEASINNYVYTPDKNHIITSINADLIYRLRITSGIALYPVFEVVDLDITLNYCGGTDDDGNTQKVYTVNIDNYSSIQIAPPTKKAYKFDYWYYNTIDPKTTNVTQVKYEGTRYYANQRLQYLDKLPIGEVDTLYVSYKAKDLNVYAFYQKDLDSTVYTQWDTSSLEKIISYDSLALTIERELDLTTILTVMQANNDLAVKFPLGYELDYFTLDPNTLDPNTKKPIPVTKLGVGYDEDVNIYMVYKKIQYTLNVETNPYYCYAYNDSQTGYFSSINDGIKKYTFTYDIDMVGSQITNISAPPKTQKYSASNNGMSNYKEINLVRITDDNWHGRNAIKITNGICSYSDLYPTYPMPTNNITKTVSSKYSAYYSFQIKYYFDGNEIDPDTDIVCMDETLPTLPKTFALTSFNFDMYKTIKKDWVFDYWYYIDQATTSSNKIAKLGSNETINNNYFDPEDGIIKIYAVMYAPLWLHVSKDDVDGVNTPSYEYAQESNTEFINAIRFATRSDFVNNGINHGTKTKNEQAYIGNKGSNEQYGLVWFTDANHTKIYQMHAGDQINREDETYGENPMHLYGKFYPLARFVLDHQFASFRNNWQNIHDSDSTTINGFEAQYTEIKILPNENTVPQRINKYFTFEKAVLEGWYTDVDLTNKYTKTSLTSEPITLYAKVTSAITFNIPKTILKDKANLPFDEKKVDSWLDTSYTYYWSYIIYTGETYIAPSVELNEHYLQNKYWYTTTKITSVSEDHKEKTETLYTYYKPNDTITLRRSLMPGEGEIVNYDYDITRTIVIDKTNCTSCRIWDDYGNILNPYCKNYEDLSTDTEYRFRTKISRGSTFINFYPRNYFPRYELADGYKAEKFYSINMNGDKIEYRLNVDSYLFTYYDSIIYYLIIEEQTN